MKISHGSLTRVRVIKVILRRYSSLLSRTVLVFPHAGGWLSKSMGAGRSVFLSTGRASEFGSLLLNGLFLSY